MLQKYKDKIQNSPLFQQLVKRTKSQSIIGLRGVPIFYVATYFRDSLANGTLGTRAGSLAFNFFLAVFPALLFLFALIPFIPIEDFLGTLLLQIEQALPDSIKASVMESIRDLTDNEREGFLLFNILLTLYFASNGIVDLMTQFNNTYLFQEKQVWWKQRITAIILLLILTVLVFTAIILISFTGIAVEFAQEKGMLGEKFNWPLVNVSRWIIVFALFYFAISFLYYLGPAKRKAWQFFSAGSSTATILIILSSIAFSYYISNFNNYNAIYGSIGSVMIIMLYFQLNSYILLLGFELNASIRKGKLGDYQDK